MTKIPLNSQSLSLTHTFTKPLLICKSLINKNSNIFAYDTRNKRFRIVKRKKQRC